MLAECLLVVLAIGMMSALCLPASDINISRYWSFGDAYLKEQSDAILKGRSIGTIIEGQGIHFGENGNVPSARTIQFEDRKIIIELGGGRLVFR